ncbi:MAG: hypothetical protein IKH77_08250 [Clostridia bacterium]|nr:hypothetical protein [Clostridia bacterium]
MGRASIHTGIILYEPSLEQLKRVIDSTGAVIVVSSAWRQIPTSWQCLLGWLEKYGLEVYDKTPYVGGERGDDITAWFNRHPGEWQYVILDDDSDMGIHMNHLVQTDFDAGLTERDPYRCFGLSSSQSCLPRRRSSQLFRCHIRRARR